MPTCEDVIAKNFRQIHFDLAARDIEKQGCVTTFTLARILRATRQTQITFNDGSSAKIIYQNRAIVYKDPKGYILNTEYCDFYG